MADNRENSRADDLYDILNEYKDFSGRSTVKKDIPADSKDKNGDGVSSIDDILEILNSGKTKLDDEVKDGTPSENQENDILQEETEIPDSILDHLTSESDSVAELVLPDEVNSHFTDHLSSESEVQIPEPSKEDEEDEDEFEDEFDDEKYETVTKTQRVLRFFKGLSFIPKAVIYILIVAIVSAYLSYYIITIGNDVFALVTDSAEVTITIEEGATHESVAKLLEENGVIKYGWVYELYMKYRGTGDDDGEYIAGAHTLNQSYNYSQIIESLTSHVYTQTVVRVTIPEGYTVDQIIDLLVESGVGERDDYVEAINNYPYKWEFVQQLTEIGYSENRKYRLEGYLYPDTYEFYNDTDEVLVINKILNAFYNKFWKDFTEEDSDGSSYQKTLLEKYGMTFDDFIVMASMVQSEGGFPEDFYYISYVFHNRLSNPSSFPKLESDATIQYVLPERVSSEELDLSLDTPYNTYLYDGLPPGAICNPGLDALNAALFPAPPQDKDGDDINAFFFVSNNRGKTYFASTKSGHEKNIEQVKKDNQAIKDGTYGQ